MKKLDILLAFRCNPKLRRELREISERIGITESAVARVALHERLRIVGTRGIQPLKPAEEQK